MRLSDFNPPTEGDATPAIQAALDAAQGGYLEWDISGRFHVNRLRPRNGTTIRYGVSDSTIASLRKGKGWPHLKAVG